MKLLINKITIYLSMILLFSCTAADLNRTAQLLEGALTTGDISAGLKQALEIGIKEGSNKLSATNGYLNSPYKILLPKEAQQVIEKLSFIPGWNSVEKTITQKLNRAAEDAAKSAAPIFVDAITKMSFNDAKNILMGPRNSATNYLHSATFNPLYAEFQPVIVNSLNKFGALDYWADAVKTYNQIPFVTKLNPKLDDYVANKALDGLFSMVEKKEAGIRTDVNQRTTALLKQVFAQQDGR